MKIIVTEELKSRLTNAALNGSVIARDILAELKNNSDVSEIIKGGANYFSTKRKKQDCSEYQKVKIVFTACVKDLTNPNFPDRNNPEAPWFPENRTDIEPSTFIGYFKNLPDYHKSDIDYFISAICVNSRITVKLYDQMSDFYDAYLGCNYTGTTQFGESSLHNSCMRSEATSRNAADFYCNFAGAKVIIARDSEKSILGRAIVWENAIDEEYPEVIVSILDRIYFSHDFIIKIIRNYAKSIGIVLRKKHNDHSSNHTFMVMNSVPACKIEEGNEYVSDSFKIKVPATQWHKKGAPYMDTFHSICLFEDGNIYLRNAGDADCFATCKNSDGYARKEYSICPVCGIIHGSEKAFCSVCRDKHIADTAFGTLFFGKTVKYKGKAYPNFLFKKGRPLPNLKRHLQIEKLYYETE